MLFPGRLAPVLIGALASLLSFATSSSHEHGMAMMAPVGEALPTIN